MGIFTNKDGDIRIGSAIFAGILGLGLLASGLSSCTKIDTGYTGVRTYMGAVQEDTYAAGLHMKVPFIEKVIEMDNRVQKVEVNAGSTSKDLQSVDSTLAVNFHLAKEASVDMYRNVGLSYEDTILQPAIQEATKSVMAQFRAEELIKSRGEVSNLIMDEISNKVTNYGIIIDEFNITNFSFSKAFDDAIEQKLVAEQNLIKTKTEQEQEIAISEANAKKKQIDADAEAYAVQIKAEGNAKAILTEAEAQAEANKKLNDSLSDKVLQNEAIGKWNGQYPSVVSGDGTNMLIDVNK
jgi:regulator of protease activity HflC (stomatin/prohibitin superfamily)